MRDSVQILIVKRGGIIMSEEREWILENCCACGGVIRTHPYRYCEAFDLWIHKSCYDSFGDEK